MSTYESKLRKGLAEVESKLDEWKNNDTAPFPDALKLDTIGQSIMMYYIEKGEDPLQSQRRDDNRFERVAARAAYHNDNRGRQRYREPYRNARNGNSRSPSPGANSYSTSYNRNNRSRSSTPARGRSNEQLRQCNFCNGVHRETTIGCPYFLRQYHIHDRIVNTDPGDLRQQVQDMERRRSRSNSRDSSRNNSRGRSQSSGRNDMR